MALPFAQHVAPASSRRPSCHYADPQTTSGQISAARVSRPVGRSDCASVSMPTVSTGQPATNNAKSNRVIVFADMLGFAALTEANPIDIRILRANSRPFSLTLDDILDGPKNPLTEAFSSARG